MSFINIMEKCPVCKYKAIDENELFDHITFSMDKRHQTINALIDRSFELGIKNKVDTLWRKHSNGSHMAGKVRL